MLCPVKKPYTKHIQMEITPIDTPIVLISNSWFAIACHLKTKLQCQYLVWGQIRIESYANSILFPNATTLKANEKTALHSLMRGCAKHNWDKFSGDFAKYKMP